MTWQVRWFTRAIAAVALLVPAGIVAGQDPVEPPVDRVRDLLDDPDDGASPGLAVVVVHNGDVLINEGYGLSNLEHGLPSTSSTAFDLASLAKQFTGLAIASLVERGKVRVEDDIRTYIPEVPDFGHTITIGHLLHHTSGLRDWPGTLAIAGWRGDDHTSLLQILRMVSRQRTLNFEPGTEYSYTNTGYTLLAELVHRVTGQPLRSWLDEQVFGPLGMSRSHVHDDRSRVVSERADSYWPAGDGSWRLYPSTVVSPGSSSIHSTTDDLVKWLVELDRPAVLDAAAVARMHTRGVLNDGTTTTYAYGLNHGEYRGAPTLDHSGSIAAFGSYMVYFPLQRLAIVLLANRSDRDLVGITYDIVDALIDDELEARRDTVSQPAPAVDVAPSVLREYAGRYELGPGWHFRIRHQDAGLTVQSTGEDALPLIPMSDTAFWMARYGTALAFERGVDKAISLRYRGIHARRLADHAVHSATDLLEFAGEYVSAELETSYRVEPADGGLILRQLRHGPITLTPEWLDGFAGSAWFMGFVQFERDGSGRITGFLVTHAHGRVRAVRFVRRPG